MTRAPHPTSPSGPLAGLRVLDLSTVVAGPFAAALLADYGADVIKVEMPGAGDALRALAPHKDGVPLWWKVTNRNKQGVTLDLHRPVVLLDPRQAKGLEFDTVLVVAPALMTPNDLYVALTRATQRLGIVTPASATPSPGEAE